MLKTIKRYVKILSVGSGFVVFGLICLFANIFLLPIIILRLYKFERVRDFSRFWVMSLWSLFLRYAVLVRYIKYDFIDLDKLKNGGNLIIANHPSLLDVVFLLSHIKNTNCIVKSELSKNIFLYPAIKCSGYLLNTENEVFLENGINALKNGENLIIFPEGTRTKGEIIFHKAAVRIGLKGAKYITPIIINMNPRSLKKGQSWYNTPQITINYTFKVLDALHVKDYLKDRPVPAMARKLNKSLVELYKKELESERT